MIASFYTKQKRNLTFKKEFDERMQIIQILTDCNLKNFSKYANKSVIDTALKQIDGRWQSIERAQERERERERERL